jgi:signal transduction histidine kinase
MIKKQKQQISQEEKRFQTALFGRLVALSSVALLISTAFLFVIAAIFSQFEKFNLKSLANNGFFYLIAIIAFILAFVISIFISKNFSKPMSKLSDATYQVAKGNFEIKLERPKRKNGKPRKRNEVDAVYENFNKMVTELKQNEIFKTDFISNVSHELKTPLATIQGYATLLQDEKLPKKLRTEYIQTIIIATKQLTNLTTNILKLSKLENQGIFTEHKQYNLAEQIRTTILSLEKAWAEKDIELDLDLDEVMATLDEDLIAQVWKNIIENAIKFSNNKGVISISLKKENNLVIVKIKDNGHGMTEQTKKHIFDKFYQGDNSHSKEGNGLGLALAKKILDIHKADVVVDSEIDKGTTFTITFKQ